MDGLLQRSNSAPSTPTGSPIKDTSKNSNKVDEFSNKHRKVQFPSDEMIVTNYFEAPDPWSLLGTLKLFFISFFFPKNIIIIIVIIITLLY